MITQLLRPQQPSANPVVEEIDGETDEEEGDGQEYLSEQKVVDVESGIRDEEAALYGYGFGWRRTGILEQLRNEIGNLLDINEPELTAIEDRTDECAEYDFSRFEEERYLCDKFEPDSELIRIIDSKFVASTQISDEDRERMKNLPKRKLPKLSERDTSSTALMLLDIIYSWCYDQRINDWENSCESGWLIAKLSPTLSYLVKCTSANEAIIGCIRRSLCYPLYRNWDLSMKVLEDTIHMFKLDRSALVHALCEVHSLMVKASEFRYLLNDLIITDLLIWLQCVPEEVLVNLVNQLEEIEIDKDDIGLDLEEIEEVAGTMMDASDVTGKLQQLEIHDPIDVQLDSDDEP